MTGIMVLVFVKLLFLYLINFMMHPHLRAKKKKHIDYEAK